MVTGEILKGKSYKTRVMPNGSMSLKFCIKDKEYFNFETFLEKGMEIPEYLQEGRKVSVDMDHSEINTWEYQGKTYSSYKVHLSMIKSAETDLPKKEDVVVDVPDPIEWGVCFERYQSLIGVYAPTQAGDLKEIMKAAGFLK